MSNLEKEAVDYLKSNKEYTKIMKALKDKYRKTGKLTGKIQITEISKEEGLLLGSIDHSLFDANKGSLSIKKFIDFFAQGKYEGIDFLKVLFEYYGEDVLKTKKEVKEELDLLKERFFIEIFNEVKNHEFKMWLKAALEFKKYGYLAIAKSYKEDSRVLKDVLINIDKSFGVINSIDEQYIPLAKFSSIVTKDSHYFDIDSFPGKLFISVLGYLYTIDTDRAEGKNEALMKVKIIRDEISNFTITYGIIAINHKEEIKGYEWFRREREPLLLNIYNLNSISNIKAVYDRVYVFENPTVFYEVLKKTKGIPVTLVCISGQPNVSSLILLDKLTDGGAKIYYSGDFDPEGLKIASSLKYRYKGKLEFFGMNVENYMSIKGDISFKERIGKLDSIADIEFKELIEKMKEYTTAGYQELLSDYYCDAIKKDINK